MTKDRSYFGEKELENNKKKSILIHLYLKTVNKQKKKKTVHSLIFYQNFHKLLEKTVGEQITGARFEMQDEKRPVQSLSEQRYDVVTLD